MIGLYIFIISIMFLSNITGLLFFIIILLNNFSLFGQNMLCSILTIISIFFISIFIRKIYIDIKNSNYNEKLKTKKGKYDLIKTIILLLTSFIFFIYPQYLSSEAINVNNFYKNVLNRNYKNFEISETLKTQSYIVPKIIKKQRINTFNLTEEIIDIQKEITIKANKNITKIELEELKIKINNLIKSAKIKNNEYINDLMKIIPIGLIFYIVLIVDIYNILKEKLILKYQK